MRLMKSPVSQTKTDWSRYYHLREHLCKYILNSHYKDRGGIARGITCHSAAGARLRRFRN